jgi:predicted TIM-barrel fold metal-dependent hydrolase
MRAGILTSKPFVQPVPSRLSRSTRAPFPSAPGGPPAEYVREHVYVTTQPMEEPARPRYFGDLLDQLGELVDHLLFASDYPHWDADQPDDSFPVRLSAELARKIYFQNAAALYGLQ